MLSNKKNDVGEMNKHSTQTSVYKKNLSYHMTLQRIALLPFEDNEKKEMQTKGKKKLFFFTMKTYNFHLC
jgi:hypothetical protein